MLPLSDGLHPRRFPVVNVALIAANFAVWLLYELSHLDSAVYHASFYPCTVDNTCWGALALRRPRVPELCRQPPTSARRSGSRLVTLLSVAVAGVLFGGFAVILAVPFTSAVATLIDVLVLGHEPPAEQPRRSIRLRR
jgi:hypothetical protein